MEDSCFSVFFFFFFVNKLAFRILPWYTNLDIESYVVQGPVVQSIISLTSSLRGQLVKCLTTL